MTLAITYTRANIGMHAPCVTVETHISNGLPSLHIVGLPETAVKESRDRVRSAILMSYFEFPTSRITVNLAPADLPKHGGRYDLPIALGILAASRQLPGEPLKEYEFAGELALSGELRPIQGILPLAISTRKANKKLIIPLENAREASLIKELTVLPARHLLDVCSHFLSKTILSPYSSTVQQPRLSYSNLREVRGQHHAKRALEIAAAGHHSVLLIGPPGVGKTLLSNCLAGILPPLTEEEAMELAMIRSAAGQELNTADWGKRPFRNPHHSASSTALIGGGNPPKPGEISLAHQGILFLDELPEFKRQALEALREPLESNTIIISRAKTQIQFPAKFQLIAAMNPCPCGQFGTQNGDCTCLSTKIKHYQARVSGPLLDRIDLQTELQPLPMTLLTAATVNEEASEEVAKRVLAARTLQLDRGGKLNGVLNNKELLAFCSLNDKCQKVIHDLIQRNKISARSYHKILRIARTIADLEKADNISEHHVKEAFSYRTFERMKIK